MNLFYGRPSEDSATALDCNRNSTSSASDASGSDPDAPSYGTLERRLHKAVKANTKWQQKYEMETWASPTCVILRCLFYWWYTSPSGSGGGKQASKVNGGSCDHLNFVLSAFFHRQSNLLSFTESPPLYLMKRPSHVALIHLPIRVALGCMEEEVKEVEVRKQTTPIGQRYPSSR